MTIHRSHPFADAEREAARQFRGRLGGRVSLWTSGELDAGGLDLARALSLDERERRTERAAHPVQLRPAGLTVSSMLAVPGEQWRLVAAIDPDSDLAESLERTGRAVTTLLRGVHRQQADVFAGLAPAPGGGFRTAGFEQTQWGPRPVDADTWAGLAIEDVQPLGWSSIVTAVMEHVVVGDDPGALRHVRGGYSVAE